MTNKKILPLAQASILAALIAMMTFTPYVGYISIAGLLSITTLHIPVIIGAILLGWRYSIFLGGVWGFTCLLYAMMQGTADAAIFLNPMISVVPRILVGFLTSMYFIWFSRLFKKFDKFNLPSIIMATICGTLTNTVLVLFAINIFGISGVVDIGATLGTIIEVAVGLNGLVELGGALILISPIVIALKRAKVFNEQS